MKISGRKIDHLVYCVPDLDAAIDYFKKSIGVEAVVGGQHLLKGTKNALINLGHLCYLEILAADDSIQNIERPRWMGIDLLEGPKITRWAIKSERIETEISEIKKYNPKLGQIKKGERQLPAGDILKWQLSEPAPLPEVEIMPFLIDWSQSSNHPTLGLKQEAELLSIALSHSTPKDIEIAVNNIFQNIKIKSSPTAQIKAVIKGPKGEIEI